MIRKKLESRLVRHVMPQASEAEIEQASERWFEFLSTLYEIVLGHEQLQHDSLGIAIDDIVQEQANDV